MESQKIVNIISLDIGKVRTGVAMANNIARIASPLLTIEKDYDIFDVVKQLVADQNVTAIVIGLPRNLRGEDTDQTVYVKTVAEKIGSIVNVPIYFSDEALTSVKAEQELKDRKKPYNKADVDMLAATYILEDFLANNPIIYET